MPLMQPLVMTRFSCQVCGFVLTQSGATETTKDCPACADNHPAFSTSKEARRKIYSDAHFSDFSPLTNRGSLKAVLEP